MCNIYYAPIVKKYTTFSKKIKKYKKEISMKLYAKFIMLIGLGVLLIGIIKVGIWSLLGISSGTLLLTMGYDISRRGM